MSTEVTLAAPDLRPLLVPIEQVAPHPDNPRRGNVEVIAESIRAHGLYRPVVAQRSTGHVLAGNHTLRALVSLGATHVPVTWVDVDDNAARRILLVDNRSSDLGTYDEALLLGLLQEVTRADAAGMTGTGYATKDVETLAALLNTVSYYDGDDYAAREAAIRARRVIHITDVPDDIWAAWTTLPGTDLERLAGLIR